MWGAVVVTLIIAAATAFIQICIRGSSRPNPPNKNHALTREDAIFWPDWVVSATVTLVVSGCVAVTKSESIPPGIWFGAIGTLVAFCLALPFAIRVWAHDPQTLQLKSGPWWVVGLNALGIVPLVVSVIVGVQVYDLS